MAGRRYPRAERYPDLRVFLPAKRKHRVPPGVLPALRTKPGLLAGLAILGCMWWAATLALWPADESPSAVQKEESRSMPPRALQQTRTDPPSLAAIPVEPPAPPEADRPWKTLRVEAGDSLSHIFAREHIPYWELQKLLEHPHLVGPLTHLSPGQEIEIKLDEDHRILALKTLADSNHILQVRQADAGFQVSTEARALERRAAYAAASIDSALFPAGQRAGLSDAKILELAELFGWEIDFNLDIRDGDHFAILYEQRYADGRRIEDGPILAAEFVNRGKSFQAVRYTDPSGKTAYYTPRGLSLRKAFLRSPVKFTRISSRFTKRRYHPVLHRFRSHKGVDYAAARGTPVQATADGKVVFRGRQGGYGKMIILEHGDKYETLYAHLSRFARRLAKDNRVQQGEVIGFVGSSGLATGPHLHYEFHIDGVHRDPLKVSLDEGRPIAPALHQDFFAKARALTAQLISMRATYMASGGQ